MIDDRFDDLLRDSAREYNDPPETPREELWQRIASARQAEKEAPKEPPTEAVEGHRVLPFRHLRHHMRPGRPLTWAAGIAAVLAIGIGLGRMSVEQPATVATSVPVPTSAAAPRVSGAAYRVATTEHLSQSEAFLTLFRASVRGKGNERLASATARQLLATNRLLLDSPAAADGRTRLLLQDLELVLAEIAQLSPQPRSRDLQLITEGMEQGSVLSRLRTAVPAGTSATQGAL